MTGRKKRAGAAVLAAALVMTAGIPAYASETGTGDTAAQSSSLNLTTSQEARYIMTIPMQATGEAGITFGDENTPIGDLSVTGDIGTKQQVSVTVEKTPFTDVRDANNHFDFDLLSENEDFEEATWNWQQVRAETPTGYALTVHIPNETWEKVPAGDYTATLTFKAQLEDVE